MSGSNDKSNDTITQQTLLWDFLDAPISEQATHLQTPTDQTFIGDVNIETEQTASIECLADRYEVLGILGKGGMGEVLRVKDQKFERTLAMKIIHKSLVSSPLIQQLFIKEAKSTGLLQHPGTVPVHDFGTLSDGRLYFTMQEIQGVTLKEAIKRVHHNGAPPDWITTHKDWSIQRLLDAFERICETMAYAHTLGIMHRDIKPSNFMLGAHGEVLVMDWGIAKILPHGEQTFPDANALRPNMGSVVGTPDYIAPEQARGESDEVNAHSDVFSLGCVLYEIITGKHFRDSSLSFKEAIRTPGPSLPTNDDRLQKIYARCTALNPTERYQTAKELHQELSRWLDGEFKRQRALEWVAKATQHHKTVLNIHTRIHQLNQDIKALERNLQKWAPIQEKQALWVLEDERNQLQQEVDLSEMNSIEWLHSALNQAPDLQEAHRVLTEIYHDQHQRALLQGNTRQATLTLELMRLHDQGDFADYLSGQGTLHTAEQYRGWKLYRFTEVQRRQIREFVQIVDSTTLPLSIGSYILSPPNSERYGIPFVISRSEANTTLSAMPVPKLNEMECWVPAGPSWIGSPLEPDNPYRKEDVDAFIMQQHPITNRQYIEFLEDLVQQHGIEHALLHAPRTNAISDSDATILYTWNEESQRFTLEPDPQGDCWDLDWPVIMISGDDAVAFAQWYSTKTGLSWRLPTPVEWEKAARGVDGRLLPWGDHFEPTWACVRGHTARTVLPATIDAHPTDISVYGVCGMAGNVQDFCDDPSNPKRVVSKGGAWAFHPEYIKLAIGRNFERHIRFEVTGFRLVRSV